MGRVSMLSCHMLVSKERACRRVRDGRKAVSCSDETRLVMAPKSHIILSYPLPMITNSLNISGRASGIDFLRSFHLIALLLHAKDTLPCGGESSAVRMSAWGVVRQIESLSICLLLNSEGSQRRPRLQLCKDATSSTLVTPFAMRAANNLQKAMYCIGAWSLPPVRRCSGTAFSSRSSFYSR